MSISFYPGPSTVYKEVPAYVQEAYERGILSINHRSQSFADIMVKTLQLLKSRLNIPHEYEIVFTSSATECWEIIAQSLIDSKSYHVYNGDFGKKWFQYTQKLKPEANSHSFDLNEALQVKKLKTPESSEVICLTQNETSNGTQISQDTLHNIRLDYSEKLIAIDATSSMAGIALDFTQADIWFASVQKCFGLPAGLALLICSPAAVEKAHNFNENKHYNSLVFMLENARNLQTHYTPNVLGIYLLMRVLENSENILETDKRLIARSKKIQEVIDRSDEFSNLCKNDKTRSTTVLTVEGSPSHIKAIKEVAIKNGILLGNGYGSFKNNTFRIANFPAIPDKDFQYLEEFLTNYFGQVQQL